MKVQLLLLGVLATALIYVALGALPAIWLLGVLVGIALAYFRDRSSSLD